MRKGYRKKRELQLYHADEGEGRSKGKEQNEHSHGSQREDGYCGTYWKSWQPRHALWALRHNKEKAGGLGAAFPEPQGPTAPHPSTFQRLKHVPTQWGSPSTL